MQHGQLVGQRYLLREPLGSGGMSVVWRGEDTLLGREVAVKVLSAEVSADPSALRRMYAEARAAASLRHDNVVEVYDYGETELGGVPMPYVVMELVGGRPLSDMLRGGALSWQLAVLIGAQVSAALAAAHDRGVVHRDVKPANVMVHSGGVKLVDFGISAAAGELEQVTGQIFGTPAYLAPERLAGGMVRPATDVYALGLLLYLMLAGRMPWNVSTTTQMLKAHRYREPAPLPAVAGLPDDIAALVRRCLDKNPSARPAAVTVARELRRAAGLPPLTLLTGLDSRDGAAEVPTEAAPVPTAAVPAPSGARARITRLPARHRLALSGALLVALTSLAFACWPAAAEPQPAAAEPQPAAATATAAPLVCHVTYTTRVASGGKAVTAVTVANTGSRTVAAWTLSFQLPGDQQLTRGSVMTWQQKGDTIEAAGRTLAPGRTTSASFDATYRSAVVLPQSFHVNDVACTAEISVTAPAAATTPAITKAAPSPVAPVARTSTAPAAVPPARKPTRDARRPHQPRRGPLPHGPARGGHNRP